MRRGFRTGFATSGAFPAPAVAGSAAAFVFLCFPEAPGLSGGTALIAHLKFLRENYSTRFSLFQHHSLSRIKKSLRHVEFTGSKRLATGMERHGRKRSGKKFLYRRFSLENGKTALFK
jgi:hypothetical protein